ncbi:MAG: hypothetical protein OEZ16_04580 [Chromatiales bacterium]|nr:hypothetical protein [Chromatiales bacterium]
MKKKRGILQKISSLFGAVSFVLAIASTIWLYLRVESVGANNPISASLMASAFFFVCVGIILTIIGRADLPDLKLD